MHGWSSLRVRSRTGRTDVRPRAPPRLPTLLRLSSRWLAQPTLTPRTADSPGQSTLRLEILSSKNFMAPASVNIATSSPSHCSCVSCASEMDPLIPDEVQRHRCIGGWPAHAGWVDAPSRRSGVTATVWLRGVPVPTGSDHGGSALYLRYRRLCGVGGKQTRFPLCRLSLLYARNPPALTAANSG
jgi:hypothetical protein